MNDKVKAAFSGVEELIHGRYFEDLENPSSCKTCAVGRLIQNLPEEKFRRAIELLKSDSHLNGRIIYSGDEEMIRIAKMLESEYEIDTRTLFELQQANDKIEYKSHGYYSEGAFGTDEDRAKRIKELINDRR